MFFLGQSTYFEDFYLVEKYFGCTLVRRLLQKYPQISKWLKNPNCILYLLLFIQIIEKEANSRMNNGKSVFRNGHSQNKKEFQDNRFVIDKQKFFGNF